MLIFLYSVILFLLCAALWVRSKSHNYHIPESPWILRVSLLPGRNGKEPGYPEKILDFCRIFLAKKTLASWDMAHPEDELALVRLKRSSCKVKSCWFFEKLPAIIPFEHSFLIRSSRLLARVTALAIFMWSLLHISVEAPAEQNMSPRKEKGSFPPFSWKAFYEGRGTNEPNVNVSDCPLKIRFSPKTLAAVDCVSGSDIHNFTLQGDTHSNTSHSNSHSDTTTSHQETPPSHTNTTPHSNSHTNSGHTNFGHTNTGP